MRTIDGVVLLGILIHSCEPAPRGYVGTAEPDTAGAIMQRGSSDCGAAALAMVLRSRGRPVAIEQVSQMLLWTPGGVSMLSLRCAAESLNFQARAFRTSSIRLDSVLMPAILFIRGNHYVVIDSIIDDQRVVLRDPAIGRIQIPLERLERVWRGEVLEVVRDEPPWHGRQRKTERR
jgi:ABC-type bacteriocin/lantibiotic exporter with double-glycine peptidase domain